MEFRMFSLVIKFDVKCPVNILENRIGKNIKDSFNIRSGCKSNVFIPDVTKLHFLHSSTTTSYSFAASFCFSDDSSFLELSGISIYPLPIKQSKSKGSLHFCSYNLMR